MRRILVTGGLGYIGSHAVVVLAGLGHEVVIYDNLSNSSPIVISRLESLTGKSFKFVNGDVRETRLMQEALLTNQIDAVFHFAGLKAVGESFEKPIDYFSNNVQGTISLLEAMNACAIRTLVFSSSATVYGDPEYLPLDENHPTSAVNPYGRSKLYVEAMLKDIARSDPSWKVACLRYFNPVGAHESGDIGERPNGVPNNLMPYIAQVAIGLQPSLKIFGDSYQTKDGTGVRDFIHIMDLADGHAAALRFLEKNPGCHMINLGSGQGHTVLEMVNVFEKVSGRKIPCQVVEPRTGDVAACYADPKLARTILGWSTRRTIGEMCASAWKFQQSI